MPARYDDEVKLRSKLSLLTGAIFLGALSITGLSLWTMSEITRLRDTIDSGTEPIASASQLHGLMKDLMFDLFTPQTYLLLKDVLHTPRSQTTRGEFRSAVAEFEAATTAFMESPRVKALLREPELRDTYDTAKTMIAKASDRIDSFQSRMDRLFDAGSGAGGGLYRELQTEDPSTSLFFDEARETSYYLTYSFESYLSHFINSLRVESDLVRRQILILFWVLALVIGAVTLTLSVGFAQRISRRIKTVEEGFRRVSGGDFTAELDVQSSDELGVLARHFNVFMSDLKRNVDSIQNLMRDVGRILADRPGFDTILALIAEAAVKDSRASGAAVLTLSAAGSFHVATSAGDFPFRDGQDLPSDLRGVELLRAAEKQGQSVFVREATSVGENKVVGSLLALPLSVSQGTMGVLCIVTGKGVAPLTDLDHTNFHTFAEYAGLIIDNYFKYQELLSKKEAEYRALQSQIQPHFLYNVLSGLIGLNRMGDSASLEKAILSLKDMLRYILDARSWTTVKEEVSFLERYLELQQMRFADRLRASCSVEAEAVSVRIPKLLLQPLVENAVIHGIEPLDRPGAVAVEARVIRNNGSSSLRLLVADDGIGAAEVSGGARGIGISNVQDRLLLAYPGSRIQINGVAGEGTRVTIEIPLGDRGDEDSDR